MSFDSRWPTASRSCTWTRMASSRERRSKLCSIVRSLIDSRVASDSPPCRVGVPTLWRVARLPPSGCPSMSRPPSSAKARSSRDRSNHLSGVAAVDAPFHFVRVGPIHSHGLCGHGHLGVQPLIPPCASRRGSFSFDGSAPSPSRGTLGRALLAEGLRSAERDVEGRYAACRVSLGSLHSSPLLSIATMTRTR